MRTVYKSKTFSEFKIILLLNLGITLVILIASGSSVYWSVAMVVLFALVFLFWKTSSSSIQYIIDHDEKIVKLSGALDASVEIPFYEFSRIRRNQSILNSPYAASQDRITLELKTGQQFHISPEKKRKFIIELQEVAPQVISEV